jgi:hypothetical protein
MLEFALVLNHLVSCLADADGSLSQSRTSTLKHPRRGQSHTHD